MIFFCTVRLIETVHRTVNLTLSATVRFVEQYKNRSYRVSTLQAILIDF